MSFKTEEIWYTSTFVMRTSFPKTAWKLKRVFWFVTLRSVHDSQFFADVTVDRFIAYN